MRKSRLDDISYYPSLRVPVSSLLPYSYVGVEHLVKDRGGVCLSPDMPNADSAIQFRPGDILLGNIRPYLKKIWLADITGGASGDVIVIRIRDEYKDSITPDYLYKVLSSDKFFAYDNLNTKGAKMPRGDKKSIAAYLIPIPSIGEQKSIVDELDLLTSIIDKKNAQLRDLDALAQSIFYEMFGNPVANDKGWPVCFLEEIASSQIGLTYKPENVSDNGTIVLRSSNIQNSMIDLNDIVRVNCDIKEKQFVREGDILMCSRNGSLRLVGKVARIHDLPERMSYGAFMTTIRSDYNDYLFGFFKTPAFRAQLGLAKTATINQITAKMLNAIQLPVPPKSIQTAFAEKIAHISAQQNAVIESLKDIQHLYDSRMSLYFG